MNGITRGRLSRKQYVWRDDDWGPSPDLIKERQQRNKDRAKRGLPPKWRGPIYFENEADIQGTGEGMSEQIERSQNVPISEQISQLWRLKQEGALTQEEFDEQKARLLES